MLDGHEAKGPTYRIAAFLVRGRFLSSCLVMALLLRLLWVAVMSHAEPVSDFRWYYERGVEIAQGRGYVQDGQPTAYWPVGYPALLGGVFCVFGPSLLAARLVNVLLSLGILLLTYRTALLLFRSEAVARVTLLLLALHPNHIAYCSLTATEILFTFLLLAGVWWQLSQRGAWLTATAAGLVGGLATLTKPQFLPIPVIVACVLGLRGRDCKTWRRQGARLLLIYAVLVVVATPWLVRNYRLFGGWPIISNNGGFNLLIGNNACANCPWRQRHEYVTSLLSQFPSGERQQDIAARALAVHFIEHHPWRTVGFIPRKLYDLFLGDCDDEGIRWNASGFPAASPGAEPRWGGRFLLAHRADGRTGWVMGFLMLLARGYYLTCLILFVLSLVPLARRPGREQHAWTVGLWVILYFTIVYSMFFGGTRFHFPMLPWIFLYVAWFIADRPIYPRGHWRWGKNGVRS